MNKIIINQHNLNEFIVFIFLSIFSLLKSAYVGILSCIVSNFLIGGFYRTHENKANNENLNSPGMIFQPIPLNDICISPDLSLDIDSQINKYYVYGVVARLAILAAAKELFNLD